MSADARGVFVRRDDLVVWHGRVPGDPFKIHLGVVNGFTMFGRVRVSKVVHGIDGDWRTTGVTAALRPDHMLVIEDAPEAIHE
jgi:hypothetical protein